MRLPMPSPKEIDEVLAWLDGEDITTRPREALILAAALREEQERVALLRSLLAALVAIAERR